MYISISYKFRLVKFKYETYNTYQLLLTLRNFFHELLIITNKRKIYSLSQCVCVCNIYRNLKHVEVWKCRSESSKAGPDIPDAEILKFQNN